MTHMEQTTAILTDELVEKVASALYAAWAMMQQGETWEEFNDELAKGHFRDFARAAILAILPDVIEACAKAATSDATIGNILPPTIIFADEPEHLYELRARAMVYLHNAIRSLLEK